MLFRFCTIIRFGCINFEAFLKFSFIGFWQQKRANSGEFSFKRVENLKKEMELEQKNYKINHIGVFLFKFTNEFAF